MRRRARRGPAPDDATPWIAYTDLLASLAALFIIATVAASGKRVQSGRVELTVSAAADGRMVAGCPVVVRGLERARSDTGGQAAFVVDSLVESVLVAVHLRCEDFDPADELISVEPGKTAVRTVILQRSGRVTIQSIPGDALFESGSFVLKPEGVRAIVDMLGAVRLEAGQVIRVRGHTDDVPFRDEQGRDNWMLSGERAAAAVRVLVDSLHISPCQVAVEGFGPYAPRARVDTVSDPLDSLRVKRARNRRIDFVVLTGAASVAESCGSGPP